MPKLTHHEIKVAFEDALDPAVEDAFEDERRESEKDETERRRKRAKWELYEYLYSDPFQSGIIHFVDDAGNIIFEFDERRDLLLDKPNHVCYGSLNTIYEEHKYYDGQRADMMAAFYANLGYLMEDKLRALLARLMKLRLP